MFVIIFHKGIEVHLWHSKMTAKGTKGNKALTRRQVQHKIIQTIKKLYKCSHCEKLFSQVGGLQRHEQLHTREKLYKCEHCDKCFSDSRKFQNHKRIHNGGKRHVCRWCGNCYKNSTGT